MFAPNPPSWYLGSEILQFRLKNPSHPFSFLSLGNMTGPIRFLQGERGGSYGRGLVMTKARGYQNLSEQKNICPVIVIYAFFLYLASSFQILDCFPDRLVKYVLWMSETFHVACLVMICCPSPGLSISMWSDAFESLLPENKFKLAVFPSSGWSA